MQSPEFAELVLDGVLAFSPFHCNSEKDETLFGLQCGDACCELIVRGTFSLSEYVCDFR